MNIELLREEALKILPHININEMQKTYLVIKKININEYLRESEIPKNSIIVLCEDEERTKLSLINVDIDIIDTQNRITNLKTLLQGKEICKSKGKSILNILNIDNYSKKNYEEIIKRRKKEKEKKSENIQNIDEKEKKEEDKKSEKKEKDDGDKERDDESYKESSDDGRDDESYKESSDDGRDIEREDKSDDIEDEEKYDEKDDEIESEENEINIKNFQIVQIKPLINEKKLNEIIINIDIYGEGIESILNQIYAEKQCKNVISILNSFIMLKKSAMDGIFKENYNYKPETLIKGFEVNKELREEKKIENIKLNKNEEKIKNMFENMCTLGNKIKNEIIEEKKSNPDKFISIEQATKNTKKIDELFCIGLLAKNLESFGVITAIEKNPKQDEESKKMENAVLRYILDGCTEKKKYDFHFDFGENENNKLLNNKEEQEKFHNKLRKKLHLEYNIPEEKIIITNPQKGSYQVSVIFMDEGFNTNIDINELKEKCKDDKEFKEISYLKQIHKSLIMEGCKLSIDMLDSRGNKKRGWSTGQKRGGFDYYPPTNGWKGFGLKVLDKYDNGNNDWIANDGNKNEWAVAYHGTGVKMGSSFTLEKATNSILAGGFKAGWGQAYAECEDARHPGQKVGIGVYCSPNPYIMESYASCASTSTCINGINYMMGFMMRVKPERIRYSDKQKDYWVLNGTTDEMRPYRIMVKAHGVDDDYLSYVTAENRRNNIGQIFHYNIIGSDSGRVWGDHIYTDDSNIAQAAVIEGLCKIGEEMEVSIKILKPQSSYSSCFKNGIRSYSWGHWDGSYIFV
jgi:hypothetical protein